MDMDPEYLLGASDDSLGSAMLDRMARATATRKQVMQLLELWSAERAEALLIEWARRRRETVTFELPAKEALPRKPGPMTAGELRESLRKLLGSA